MRPRRELPLFGLTLTARAGAKVGRQGFETGEVDAVLENWGHADLKKKHITRQKTTVSLGQAGNKGITD